MNYNKFNYPNVKNRNYDNINDEYINNNMNNQMNPNYEFDNNINEKNIETKSVGIGMTPREEKQSIQTTNELNIINNKNIKDKKINENVNNISKEIVKNTIIDNDKKEN